MTFDNLIKFFWIINTIWMLFDIEFICYCQFLNLKIVHFCSTIKRISFFFWSIWIYDYSFFFWRYELHFRLRRNLKNCLIDSIQIYHDRRYCYEYWKFNNMMFCSFVKWIQNQEKNRRAAERRHRLGPVGWNRQSAR